MHSTASDGIDTPEELLGKIISMGIKTFALADHDTIKGDFVMLKDRRIKEAGIKFFPAIEFSCQGNQVKSHVLGYGCDLSNKQFLETINEVSQLRILKHMARLERLKNEFRIEFPKESIEHFNTIDSVGKPHIAEEMLRLGFTKSMEEGMKMLSDKNSKSIRVYTKDAIDAIHAAGGIAVWAHPLGGEGAVHYLRDELLVKLKIQMEFGIDGLECYYSRYSIEEMKMLVEIAKERGLLISGGSDYHGPIKTISPGELCADDLEVKEENLTLIAELEKRRNA